MGYPTDTGDAAFNPVTRNPRTPQLVDEYGNRMFYGTTDNANANFPIDSRIVEFQQYGILNGSFARGPQDPNHDITDINAMPDWTGPVSDSGGAITSQWVVDASSPSGYNLRFTINAGAAGDEAHYEQIVPIGGTRSQQGGMAVWATVYCVATTDPGFTASVQGQYLDATAATVGAAFTTTSAAATAGNTSIIEAVFGSSIPSTARSLRIRLDVRRSTATAADTCTFDFSDVRPYRATPIVMVADQGAPATYEPASLTQTNGILALRVHGGVGLNIDSANSAIYARAGNVVWVNETTAGTPSTGYHAIYAKSADSKLYSKSDGGVEYLLSLVAGTDYLTSTALAAAYQPLDADLTTLAAATVATGQTFTPALAFATVGSSTWATTTAVGFYSRLLDRVIFHGFYQGVPTNGTAAGNLTLTGLPVTSNATANSSSIVTVVAQGWTKAGYTAVGGQINASSTIMVFPATGSAQAISNLVVADIPTGGTVIVRFNGVYFL